MSALFHRSKRTLFRKNEVLDEPMIPPETDVYVIQIERECEKRVWSKKRSQRKTERHLLAYPSFK